MVFAASNTTSRLATSGYVSSKSPVEGSVAAGPENQAIQPGAGEGDDAIRFVNNEVSFRRPAAEIFRRERKCAPRDDHCRNWREHRMGASACRKIKGKNPKKEFGESPAIWISIPAT